MEDPENVSSIGMTTADVLRAKSLSLVYEQKVKRLSLMFFWIGTYTLYYFDFVGLRCWYTWTAIFFPDDNGAALHR